MSQFEKRLRQELDNINRDPPDGVTAGPDGEDLKSWSASIAGPDDSPYAGGTFFLHLTYPSNYPFAPPIVKFNTKVYHPNISTEDGSVFVDILGDRWCNALTISTLLVSIRSLLTDPNPEDPVEPEIGHEYVNDRETFDQTAWEWTLKYAMGDGT
jgi:ubiquitin-conjugating enzyme E2 D/E